MEQIKVLLVEDNIDHRFLSLRAFESPGDKFHLVTAKSGAEALEFTLTQDFDVAFVDHHLPDIDGLGLMKKMHEIAPILPIVITTGQGSEELAVATFREGAIDYIIKNQNYFSLLPIVALRIKRAQREKRKLSRPAFNVEKVYDQILSASAELLDIHASSLMLYDESNGYLDTKAHRGLSHNYLNHVRPKLGESLEGQAVAESRSIFMHNVEKEPSYLFKDLAENEGIRSAMSVPFLVDGDTKGVLNLYSHNANRFKDTDEKVASHLVKLSTLALQSLKLYYREHHIAETLQRSHFPEIESRFESWDIAHRYKASMEEAMLGGDFYDMFPISGNRRAIVVADVSGKGINAAALTAMVKHTLRSYALDDPDPAIVLSRTHNAFCSYVRTEHFVTMFYGILDTASRTIYYCSAGHPPALFYSARTQQIKDLTDVHLPIGAGDGSVAYTTSSIVFEPGDDLLVYTDGLTDCRKTGLRSGELFGQTNLEKLFVSVAGQKVEDIAEGVFDHIVQFSSGKMRDDIAFFVIKFRPAL